MLVILWCVLVLSGFLCAYFYGTTQEEIRQLMPLEFQGRHIYPFHIQYYLFSSGVPLGVQKKYLMAEVFSIILLFCIAALFAVYRNYILFGLFVAVSVYGLWNVVRNFRHFFKTSS